MFPPLDSKLLDCAMFVAVQCSLVSISETLPRFEAVFGLIASEVLFFSFLFFLSDFSLSSPQIALREKHEFNDDDL